MNASIITIGDEILIGQIVDTNSVYIASKLNTVGFRVTSKISIADSSEQITQTLTACLSSNDIVIITGGLGPTKDDITKSTLAEYFNTPLIHNEKVSRHVEHLMELRGVAYNSLNRAQAMLPEACTVLFNEHGTAAGMWFESGEKIVISLPGVPFEMKALIDNQVLPRLKERFNTKENIHRTMITAGLAESILAERIATWEEALPHYIKLAYLPSFGRVRLRLSAYETEGKAIKAEIDSLFSELEKSLDSYFIGYESASIEEIIHQKLISKGATLAVAESCTGGNIAAKFTAMAGASAYFTLGAVTYSNEAKEQILGVDATLIEQYGAVSEQVAIAMAKGARQITGATYAIATTGIAGPTGGSQTKPVGTVWFGIATPEHTFAIMKICGTQREQVIGRATTEAIMLLNREI